MVNIFTKHPGSVNESYGQHLKFALCFGSQMMIGGIACVIHGIFPFLFQRTGTLMVNKLAKSCRSRCQVLDELED